jgi:methylated-DNA-[protein]-cysteine S-methyltransferase
MPTADFRDLEAVLRRGAELDVSVESSTSARRAMQHAGGQSLVDVAVGYAESPCGQLLIAVTRQGLARIAYDPQRRMLDELAAMIGSRVVELPAPIDPVRRQLDEYFASRRRRFDLALDFALTSAFGRAAYEAAVQIPVGEVATYGELAARVGSPGAARAVGNAMGANPIPIVVPCHRVVPASGGLGKYTGGVWRKELLLELEGAPARP